MKDTAPFRIVRNMRPGQLTAAAATALALFAGSAVADIKIGVLMPLSGKGSSYGQHQKVALDMAKEKIAQTGIKGEPVTFVTYDTRGENAEAINLTRRLVHNDKVLAIIGPFFSAENEVAFPVANQAKTPIINASAAKPGIAAKNRPWAFRNALASDQMNGQLIEAWLNENPDVKSVVILTDAKDAFTKGDGTTVFPAVLKAKGVKVLDNISYQTGDIDFAAQITKAKQLHPDGIVLAALYNEGGNIIREIRKQGLEQPVVGGVGVSDQKFVEIAGAAADGTMSVSPFWADSPDPTVSAWVEDYERRSGVIPNNPDVLIYDTVFILKSCVETSGVTNEASDLAADREKIRDCLEKVSYQGIAGPVRFNADGDAVLQPSILQAEGGKWTSLQSK